MKQPKYPVIATTMEALLKQEYGIIYVDEFLLAEEQEKIIQMMNDHEYVIPKKREERHILHKRNRTICFRFPYSRNL